MRRQRARETAFLLMYRMDMGHLNLDEAKECVERVPDVDIWQYSQKLAETVLRQQAEIDRILHAHSPEWSVERMSSTDRSILRLAVGELLFLRDAPVGVLIDQALRLAEKYGGEESSHFVHGVLGAILRDEPADVADPR
ncbi:MAG: transcription antitermination factor NusB [bacterium]